MRTLGEAIPTSENEEVKAGPNAIPVSLTPLLTREIVVEKPTLKGILDTNREYLEWLETAIDVEAANAHKQHLQQLVIRAPPTGTRIQIPLRKLGESLIWPYTSKLQGVHTPSDPINLIFWNEGKADEVYAKLANYFIPPWHDVEICSEPQYTYVDNGSFGGYKGWIRVAYSLANCVCLGFRKRCHIRLFDCVDREPKQFGNFAVANIHYEEASVLTHKVKDWDRSQQFIDCLFTRSFPFTGTKAKVKLQPKGEELQNVKHDGVADAIELRK